MKEKKMREGKKGTSSYTFSLLCRLFSLSSSVVCLFFGEELGLLMLLLLLLLFKNLST